MKRLIIISGGMGVGKSSVSLALVNSIVNSVFLDGDYCCQQGDEWIFDDETKKLALDSIVYVLKNHFKNRAFENIVFCWPLHKVEDFIFIKESIVKLYTDVEVNEFSLVAKDNILYERISARCKMRAKSNNSLVDDKNILQLYEGALKQQDLLKRRAECIIDTSNKSLDEIVDIIIDKLTLKKGKKKQMILRK